VNDFDECRWFSYPTSTLSLSGFDRIYEDGEVKLGGTLEDARARAPQGLAWQYSSDLQHQTNNCNYLRTASISTENFWRKIVLSLGVEFILIYDFYILGCLFIYLFIYFYKF
jgi:hypothetical protein